jgi:hypothetical protein
MLTSILQLLLITYDAHQAGGIWKLPSTLETADVIEPAAPALRPRGFWMHAVKYVCQDPLYPCHSLLLHNRGLIAVFIKCLSFFHALASN